MTVSNELGKVRLKKILRQIGCGAKLAFNDEKKVETLLHMQRSLMLADQEKVVPEDERDIEQDRTEEV